MVRGTIGELLEELDADTHTRREGETCDGPRYFEKQGIIRPYAEGSVGIGWISDINAELSAPGANVNQYKAAFFHSTTALTWAANAGLLWQAWSRAGFYAQLGMRYTSGLSTNDVGGLPGVTDGTSRWSLRIVIGVRYTVK